MLNLVLAVLVGVWFFFAAKKVNKQPIKWAAIGALLFGGVTTAIANLSFWLASPIQASNLAAVGITVVAGSFLVGIVLVLLVYSKNLKATAQ